MPFTWTGVAIPAIAAGDAMRDRLVAGLYPQLNGKVVTLESLYLAVDEFLGQSGYTDLAATVFAADQLVQAFQADAGVPAPTGYEEISDDWTTARDSMGANPVNTELIQTLEP